MKRAKKQLEEEHFDDDTELANVDEEADDNNDDDDDDDDEASISSEKIDVEFEAFGLCDDDIDGICQLLKQVFLKSSVNLTELAKILVDQINVGCIFKTVEDETTDPEDEDNEVYGVVSILDMKENQSKNVVQQIKSVFQKRFQQQKHLEENSKRNFDEFFQNTQKRIGFLINERCINLPHHIALPAFESLTKEIRQSGRRFDQFLMILKIHKQSNDSACASAGDGNKKKKNRKRKSNSNVDNSDVPVLFANAEEEFLAEECEIYFDYNVSDECDSATLGKWDYGESNYKPWRRVVLFDEEILNRFVKKMFNEINSSSNG